MSAILLITEILLRQTFDAGKINQRIDVYSSLYLYMLNAYFYLNCCINFIFSVLLIGYVYATTILLTFDFFRKSVRYAYRQIVYISISILIYIDEKFNFGHFKRLWAIQNQNQVRMPGYIKL